MPWGSFLISKILPTIMCSPIYSSLQLHNGTCIPTTTAYMAITFSLQL